MTKLGWGAALALLAGCPNGPLGTVPTKSTGPNETPTDVTPTTPSHGTTTPTGAGDWCAVQSVFDSECVVCHNPTLLQGGLDLQTDPYGATVGVASSAYGGVLVQPGDANGSLLYRKMAGTQSGSEGAIMPPGGILSAADLQIVEQWIDDGASSTCSGTVPTTGSGAYHPSGWDSPDQHGMNVVLQGGTDQNGADCRTCHGSDLTGGTSTVSCDTCHQAGWRTDCTYCHGGTDNATGAPPRDIDGSDANLSFAEHTAHVAGPDHPEYDCVQCHVKPTDVLSVSHIWDDPTPGEADVAFAGGISDQGTFSGASCDNLWCHGNGRGDNGQVSIGSGPKSCSGCHGTSGGSLSGRHGDHLGEGLSCDDCHNDAGSNSSISDPDRHVDGTVDVTLPSGISFDGSTCTGTCHGEGHNNRTW